MTGHGGGHARPRSQRCPSWTKSKVLCSFCLRFAFSVRVAMSGSGCAVFFFFFFIILLTVHGFAVEGASSSAPGVATHLPLIRWSVGDLRTLSIDVDVFHFGYIATKSCAFRPIRCGSFYIHSNYQPPMESILLLCLGFVFSKNWH